jgi:hypothetical protein
LSQKKTNQKMDPKTVAIRLRKLASDPDNQTYIVKEKGCMSGLQKFLDHKDESVLLIALQALQFLSSHPLNKEPLSKIPGLLAKLVNIADHDNVKVQQIANHILENLESVVNGNPQATAAPLTPSKPHNRRGVAGTGAGSRTAGSKRRTGTSAASDVKTPGFKPRYLFNIPLNVRNVNTPDELSKIEKSLLRILGVVSITSDFKKREMMIYSRKNDATMVSSLTGAVQAMGFDVEVGQGDSPFKPHGSSSAINRSGYPSKSKTKSGAGAGAGVGAGAGAAYPSKANNENNAARANSNAGHSHSHCGPSYANASGKKSKYTNGTAAPGYVTAGSANKFPGYKLAVTKYASVAQSTLDARAKQQKKEQLEQQQKRGAVSSLLGAVTGYFW